MKRKVLTSPNRRGATESGLHFWSLFKACGRKFFFRHGLGFKPRFTKRPLLFGAMFHDAKSKWYLTGNEKATLDELKVSARSRIAEYENTSWISEDVERGAALLLRWIVEYGRNDLRFYKVIATEREFEARLPNGFHVTFRPDVVLEDSDGKWFVGETKTSSFSIDLTVNSLELGDQATTYLWGLQKVFPKERIVGVLPDIAHWYKQKNAASSDPSKIVIFRGDYIMRTPRSLREYELYTMDTLEDIARRMQAVREGKVPACMAFGRRGEECFSYHSTCEYAGICMDTDLHAVPEGFTQEKTWKDQAELTKMLALSFDLPKYARKSISEHRDGKRKAHSTLRRDHPVRRAKGAGKSARSELRGRRVRGQGRTDRLDALRQGSARPVRPRARPSDRVNGARGCRKGGAK